ncbi:ABC transporter permease, partial [Rhizobium ruizarguesonis]
MSTFHSPFVLSVASEKAGKARFRLPLPGLETLTPYLVPVAIVALWQLASSAVWISSRIMPSPADVGLVCGSTTGSGQWPNGVRVSAGRAFAGLLVGGAIGVLC